MTMPGQFSGVPNLPMFAEFDVEDQKAKTERYSAGRQNGHSNKHAFGQLVDSGHCPVRWWRVSFKISRGQETLRP